MGNGDLEILEPISNEFLFSWVIRMAKWYCVHSFNKYSMKPFLSILLDPKSNGLLKLFIPENLEFLVRTINLPKSEYFGSVTKIINNMTDIPFYKSFIKYSVEDYDHFYNNSSIRSKEHMLGLRDKTKYIEGTPNIKICKSCIIEKNEFYLDKEHQVQNNFICYKHDEILMNATYYNQSYLLNKIWGNLNNFRYCIELTDNFIDVRKKAARMIHEIYLNKLSVSDDLIKSKLRKKLFELNYINNTNYDFNDCDRFWRDFSKFNILSINTKQFFQVITTTKKGVNPLAYITFILFLFGTLDNFNDYIIKQDEIMNLSYYKDLIYYYGAT